MAAANQHKLNLINHRNEPQHEKERVKISDTAKFQKRRPNTPNDRHLKNPKIRDKCMAWMD